MTSLSQGTGVSELHEMTAETLQDSIRKPEVDVLEWLEHEEGMHWKRPENPRL